mgnify:CR=1 FL=1
MPKVVPTGDAVPSVGELMLPDTRPGGVSWKCVRGVGGGSGGGRSIWPPGLDPGSRMLAACALFTGGELKAMTLKGLPITDQIVRSFAAFWL